MIIRYLRFRPGDVNCPRFQDDALSVDKSASVILDHVSASWSVDETVPVTGSDRVTVQWSFITESLNRSCHDKGQHGYGSLLRYGNGGITFHHNLYAHHMSRNPRIGDELGVDFVNNVIYDHGGEAGYSGAASEGVTRLNYGGNYVVAGPSTSTSRRTRAFLGGSENTHIYQAGNFVDGNLNKVRDGADAGWGMFAGAFTRRPQRFDFPQTGIEEAPTAYARVLESAGASLARDGVDLRIVAEVTEEDGRIINSQTEAGGWPELASRSAPPDTDRDGIPDVWEVVHGLDPRDPQDGAAPAPSGYTNLEIYLNELVSPPEPRAGTRIVDDTFEDGNSQNQDLDNNSLFLFDGRATTVRTDEPGAASFDMTATGGSSEAFWAFFTKPGAPATLGVGDRLSVSVTFSLSGFTANGSDIRWGVFDSLGTRNTANLTAGMNDATFVNDTGWTSFPAAADRRSFWRGVPFSAARTCSTPSAILRRSQVSARPCGRPWRTTPRTRSHIPSSDKAPQGRCFRSRRAARCERTHDVVPAALRLGGRAVERPAVRSRLGALHGGFGCVRIFAGRELDRACRPLGDRLDRIV